MRSQTRQNRPLSLGVIGGVPAGSVEEPEFWNEQGELWEFKRSEVLPPGTVWLLSQDGKSPRLEPWGMKV